MTLEQIFNIFKKEKSIPSVKSYSIKFHFCHESKDVQLVPKTKEKRTFFFKLYKTSIHITPSLSNFSALCSHLPYSLTYVLPNLHTRTEEVTPLTLKGLGTKEGVCPIQLWAWAIFLSSTLAAKTHRNKSDYRLRESILNLSFVLVKYQKPEKLKLQLTVCLARLWCINEKCFVTLK